MTQASTHPYHGIIGRRDITTELRERIGYPIKPDIYAVFFVQNSEICSLEIVERDESELDNDTDELFSRWKTTVTPLIPFRNSEQDGLYGPGRNFEDNLAAFLESIEPFDFTPLGIDLHTHEVWELILEEYQGRES